MKVSLSVCTLLFADAEPGKRALFEFSPDRLADAAVGLKRRTRSRAVVLLATCDRIELWCEDPQTSLYEPLCRELGLSPLAWRSIAFRKEGDETVRYLFELACGLHSPLFGEDQIISQLSRSIERSRLCGCASPLTERLFGTAVATAKRVQSSVDLAVVDRSVAEAVADLLNRRFGALVGLPVLVIGSSALARLTASVLIEDGAGVDMTIRDMDKADFLLPDGAGRIPYEERFSVFGRVRAVVSATKGISYTVDECAPDGPELYVDLAGPRDIADAVASRPGVTLVTLESLGCPMPARDKAVAEASAVIDTAVSAFFAWETARPLSSIRNAGDAASEAFLYRIHKPLSRLPIGEGDRTVFRQTLASTVKKTFEHALYEMHGHGPETVRYDLSHSLKTGRAAFPGDPDTSLDVVATVERDGCRVLGVSFSSHAGTHLDAPAHVFAGGKMLDAYPLSSFFAAAYVIDCRGSDEIDLSLVKTVPEGTEAVLFCTGHSVFWGTDAYLSSFPVLNEAAIRYLLTNGIRIFGFDCVGCDPVDEPGLVRHKLILGSGALIAENLCNLEALTGMTVELTALPLLLEGSEASPARIVAVCRT